MTAIIITAVIVAGAITFMCWACARQSADSSKMTRLKIGTEDAYYIKDVARGGVFKYSDLKRFIATGELKAQKLRGRWVAKESDLNAFFFKAMGINSTSGEKLYGLKDLEPICGVSRKTLKRYVDAGKLKAKKIDGKWEIKESDLNAFLDWREGRQKTNEGINNAKGC